MIRLKKFLKVSSIAIGTIALLQTTYLIKPQDLLKNPSLIQKLYYRSILLPLTGLKILYIYKEPFSSLNKYERNIKAARVLRNGCEKAGGCLLKIGQNIACLNLLIPDEFCEEMSKLFENCPEKEFYVIKRIVEKELGDDIYNIFESFDEKPISSASLSQVHKGILKSNGEKVAIKVQHKEIQSLIKMDILILEYLITAGKFFFKDFHFDWLVRETRRNLFEEIDFMNEIINCKKLKPFLKNSNVRTPKFYEEFSTSKILTMEYINGYSITKVDKLKKDNIDINDVAKNLTLIFNKMIFEYGFFHGDPHPGNIFITKKENTNKYDIILLDHGLYRFLNDKTKLNYSKMWCGIFLRDEKLLLKAIKDIGIKKNLKLFTEMVTRQEFKKIMSDEEKNIKKRMKVENKDLIREYVIKHRIEIFECFEEMDNDLVLIFKVIDYLNHIDYKLGEPINNFYYNAKYAFKTFRKNFIYKNRFEKIKLNFLMYGTLFFIKFYEYYLRLKYYFIFT